MKRFVRLLPTSEFTKRRIERHGTLYVVVRNSQLNVRELKSIVTGRVITALEEQIEDADDHGSN